MDNRKLLHLVENEYMISIQTCEQLRSHILGTHFILTDTSGQKYLLKRYSQDYEMVRIETVWNVCRCLKNSEILISEMVRVGEKINTYVMARNGIYILYKYIDGTIVTYERAREVGELLCKVHKSLESIPYNCDSTQARMRRAYEEIKEEKRSSFGDFMGDQAWRRMVDCINNEDACGYSLIHGDFNRSNIITDVTGNIGILDFDELRLGNREEDVAAWVFSALYSEGTIKYDHAEDICEFLKGYYRTTHIKGVQWKRLQSYLHKMCAMYLAERGLNFNYLKRHKSTFKFLKNLVDLISDDDICAKIYANSNK